MKIIEFRIRKVKQTSWRSFCEKIKDCTLRKVLAKEKPIPRYIRKTGLKIVKNLEILS